MLNLSFHAGLNGVATVLLAGGSAVLVAFLYRRAYATLQPGKWFGLYALRITAMGIIGLLLLRPVLQFERTITEPRKLVFLIDRSGSMRIADDADGRSRLAQVKARLQAWLGTLQDTFEIQCIAFADSVRHLDPMEQVESLTATGEATSLSRALTAARRMAQPDRIEAALLLSDGVHNSAGDPIDVASHMPFPVHTIGTGTSVRNRRAYRDVRVTDFECPDQLFLNNKARLTGYVDATGFPGYVIRLVLKHQDQELAEQEVTLDDQDGPQEVTFEITPAEKGLHTYTIEVPAHAEEQIAENNRRSASTRIVDARIRVLYLEGTLRAEYGAIVGRFLSRDPVIEFCALVQKRQNEFTQRSNMDGLELSGLPEDPELLASFDVFLIGDLDRSYFQSEVLDRIRQRVREGAGILMMGGYHSLGPGGYGDSPLAEVLPVFLGDRQVGQSTDPFLPRLTPDGQRHPIFANIAHFFPTRNQTPDAEPLPPLLGCVRTLGAKPSGLVLAEHPHETVRDQPLPLLVVQPVDAGRSAVFTGDTTWNWHQTLRARDHVSPFLRFWGQTVRWLAGRDEAMGTEPGIAATTDKSCYEPESEIRISAIVRGQEGEGTEQARVHATIRRQQGGTFSRAIRSGSGPGTVRGSIQAQSVALPMQPVTGPAGHYETVFVPQSSGRYEIQVAAETESSTLKADPMTVEVGRPYLEFDRLDLDEARLIAIANKTRGRYTHITTADRLIDRLVANQRARRIPYELSLAPPMPLWMIFVAVLTTEWILRKKYQLR